MKIVLVALIATLFVLTGCANAQTQHQLDAANQKIVALQHEHDLDAARMQEVRAQAGHDAELCMRAMGIARSAEDYIVKVATDAYNSAEPYVANKLGQAWTDGVPAVEDYARKAYDAARKEIKEVAKDASK
jgi:outer membrane murein-binding lipoprotein Lpp